MAKTERIDPYAVITAHVLKALQDWQANPEPWACPWANPASDGRAPYNATTDKAYSGTNWLLLTLASTGGPSKFATYKQWQELGRQVAKGSKGHTITKWGEFAPKGAKIDPKTGKLETVPYLRLYTVFNESQLADYAEPETTPGAPIPHRPESELDRFFQAIGADIRIEGAKAFYTLATDTVTVPPLYRFFEPSAFYATLGHELIHWTGAPRRLDRFKNLQSKNGRGLEELTAELGAAMLCHRLGIRYATHADTVGYLGGWIDILGEDPRAIVKVAAAAARACQYLLDQATAGAESAAVAQVMALPAPSLLAEAI